MQALMQQHSLKRNVLVVLRLHTDGAVTKVGTQPSVSQLMTLSAVSTAQAQLISGSRQVLRLRGSWWSPRFG